MDNNLATNEYYFTKILKGKSKVVRAKCYKIASWNADSELQMINSTLSSLCSISASKDNHFQTLDKFESKVINEGEYIWVTLSNQYYPKTLRQYLDETDEKELPEEDCLSYIYQITKWLDELKRHKLVKFHGNLKLSNIFLDEDNMVTAIGDFYIKHITNKVNENEDLYKTMINHLPPEFFTLNHDRDEHSDIWSLGIILYQLSTGGNYPFLSETDDDEFDDYATKRNIINVDYEKLDDREQTQLLLDQIFTAKPLHRIKIDDILKTWSQKIDMKRLGTAMKKQVDNRESSDDNSDDDIKKKLDFLIHEDASEEEIMKRHSVTTGLDYK